jgi:uncharacterized protein (TIGR02217 family)
VSSFLESPRFPDDLASYGSSGGPTWSTEVIQTDTGFEYRNSNWSQARHRYDVAAGVADQEDFVRLKSWFLTTRGPAIGFRFRDFGDYSSRSDGTSPPTPADQRIGTGNGTQTSFQLVKRYPIASGIEHVREIRKPVPGTVLIALNGAPQTTGWTVNTATGVVTFSSPPAASVIVTAGFEFDVPVRFAEDAWSFTFEDFDSGSASVPLLEIRT